MRYLYGDSTPFPLGYNFLATLEAFMHASTRIVQLDLEGALLHRQREELGQSRVKGLEALEQFHNVVMRAVRDTAQKVQHQNASEYARTLQEYATHYIEEHRKVTLAANEREVHALREDSERRAADMRVQVEAFLKSARFPVARTKVSLVLGDGRDGRYSGTASFEHPDGIATAFTLAPTRTATFAQARRVVDFAQEVNLRVGVEKSWLRGTVTAKQVAVDDWTLLQIEVTDDRFECVLRKKLGEKELLVFHVHRSELGVLSGTVEHPGAPGAETLPNELGSQDLAQLDRVWAALVPGLRELTDQKDQLVAVTLDGQPVFENGLAVPFVHRLVAMFAPTVREIAARSPNEYELTLKVESDSNRREELFLKKDALVGTLQPLPAKGREVFAPLGFDSWVPSMTNAPPAAVPSERPPHSSRRP